MFVVLSLLVKWSLFVIILVNILSRYINLKWFAVVTLSRALGWWLLACLNLSGTWNSSVS